MMKPTVHLNGTAAADLYDGFYEAANALDEALHRLYETCPNGRDYYPQGNAVIHTAMEEHRARVAQLQKMKDEMEALALHVQETGGLK